MSNKQKRSILEVQGSSMTVLSREHQDFIRFTNIAKFKNPDHADDVSRNWLRNRGIVEFLGVWK